MGFYEFDKNLITLAEKAEKLSEEQFREIDRIERYNTEKVLSALQKNKVGAMHLLGSNGYGYDDCGRDKLDEVYSDVFRTESALVRHNFINGTHAISTALFGILRPNDMLLSLTGKPYDTLSEVIFGETGGSLKEFGINYDEISLFDNGKPDYTKIENKAKNCKVAYIQRSRGYSLRPSLTIDVIEMMIEAVKKANPNAIIIVDNCYGELCEEREPTEVGADIAIGSLIKNLGGGIAETGGYIVGRADLIELCANRLTTVGIGREAGCTLTQNRGMYLGLFHAPSAVAGALKTSVFCAAMLGLLGYKAYPQYFEKRTDIIAAFELGGKEELVAFCKGIQAGSPIDSFVTPEPWAMPGYDSEVIMAAGAFTQGASIELSADAPIRQPFAVYIQGGLNFSAGRIGILTAVDYLLKYKGTINHD